MKEAEHARYLTAHARKVLRSLPVVDYIEEQRRLKQQWNGAAGNLDLSNIYYQRMIDHKDANAYPPGLVGSVDDALLRKASTAGSF